MNSINSIDDDKDDMIRESAIEKRLLRFTLIVHHSYDLSDLTYLIILVLDFLQIISIIINGNFYDKWEGQGFQYVKQALGLLTLQSVIKTNSQAHIGMLIASIILMLVIIFAFIFFNYCGTEFDNVTQTQKILGNIVGLILVMTKAVLQIPFIYIILSAFIQKQSSKNVQQGLAIFLIILLAPIIFYEIFIFSNSNPFSTFPLAGQTCSKKLTMLAKKIFLVIFSTLDTNKSFQLLFLIIVLLIHLFAIIYNRKHPNTQFNPKIRKYTQWQRCIVVWLILFLIVCNYTSTKPGLWIYFIFVAISIYGFIQYINQKLSHRLLHQDFVKLENSEQIRTHILQLIYLIDSTHTRQSRILLEGYISFHIRNCNLPNSVCQCRQIFKQKKSQLDDLKYSYYEFVANLLKGCLNRIDDPRRIYLLKSYVYQYRLNNKFQAINCLIRSASINSSFLDRLLYLQQLKLIQSDILEQQNKKNANLAVDLIRFLKFNVKVVQFEQLLQTCSKNYVNFWNQLLQVHLNIHKLESCGAIIANQKETVKDFFNHLLQLNSNNAHIMMLYGQFLAWVCNEDFQNLKLIQKGETILKNLKESSKFNGKNEKYSDNSHTSIIVISGNEKQLGKIIQTNNYVYESFGYHRKQLISNNITLLMPKIFAENHDNALRRFLTTSKDKLNGVQRMLPALSKEGFIFPMLALTRPLPNLQQGVQLVGFLSFYELIHDDQISGDSKVSYILYDCETEIVMGISKTCLTQYGIPKCLVYGDPENSLNQLKIKHIFGFNIEKSQGGIQNGRQIIAEMNTKNLRDEFIITNQASTNKIIQLANDTSIGTSKQVIIRSILQINYFGTPLRIISIIKDDFQKQCQPQTMKSTKQDNSRLLKQQKSDSKSQTDELKDLKDFKNFISIKRQPAAIQFINFICIVLILIFFGGVSGFIVIHNFEFQLITSTMEAVHLAFQNRMFMTQLSFEIQKIYINYSQAYPPGEIFPEKQAISKMTQIISKSKHNELQILPLKYQLGVQSFNVINFDFYTNGTYRVFEKSIDESISVQLNQIGNIFGNGKYLKYYPLNYKSLTVLNYLQTKYTQIFSFVDACSRVQQTIINEGIQNNKKFQMYIIIESIILAVIAFIWILVSMPRTLQVTDINSKVLSLFSLINSQDVIQIIKKCHIYQKRFLIQATVIEKPDKNVIKQVCQQTPFQQKTSRYKLKKNDIELPKFSPGPSGISSLNSSFAVDTSARNIVVGEHKELKGKQSQINQSIDIEPNNKMINNGNGDKRKGILTFIVIFMFLIGYLGTITGYLIINYNDMWAQTMMMSIIYNRTAQFQQIKTAYTFYLSDSNLSFANTSIDQINLDLITKMYDTEVALTSYQQGSIYASIINNLNTDNLCEQIQQYQNYKVWGDTYLNYTECNTVQNGVLTRGIKTSFVAIMEEIRGMISLTATQKSQLDMYVQTINTIKKFTILQKFIVRPLLMISSQIIGTIKSNQARINIAFYVINCIFLIAMLSFWRFGWTRHLESLNESVWRTKSMLNIIPTKIITNNEVLMNQFTSGQLEKIVK